MSNPPLTINKVQADYRSNAVFPAWLAWQYSTRRSVAVSCEGSFGFGLMDCVIGAYGHLSAPVNIQGLLKESDLVSLFWTDEIDGVTRRQGRTDCTITMPSGQDYVILGTGDMTGGSPLPIGGISGALAFINATIDVYTEWDEPITVGTLLKVVEQPVEFWDSAAAHAYSYAGEPVDLFAWFLVNDRQ